MVENATDNSLDNGASRLMNLLAVAIRARLQSRYRLWSPWTIQAHCKDGLQSTTKPNDIFRSFRLGTTREAFDPFHNVFDRRSPSLGSVEEDIGIGALSEHFLFLQ
jgi:hypothetical protein